MDESLEAEIWLCPTAEGGLKGPMPSPTPSLILVFPPLDEDLPGDVQIGGLISATGSHEFRPGNAGHVEIDFASDIGRIYATPGATFSLWHAGRVVGSGVVLPYGHEHHPEDS